MLCTHTDTHTQWCDENGKEEKDISNPEIVRKRDTHLSNASFPSARCRGEGAVCLCFQRWKPAQWLGDLSTAALSLLYGPLHHHTDAVNPSSN